MIHLRRIEIDCARPTMFFGSEASCLRNASQQTCLGLRSTMRRLIALWDRASQLTGQDYDINPLEVFVFGGAILLHDAGHAVAAYVGGLTELKETVEYRDAAAAALRKMGLEPLQELIANPPPEIAKIALFTALRRLHAKQAEILAARAFHGEHLIEDKELRENLAQLIAIALPLSRPTGPPSATPTAYLPHPWPCAVPPLAPGRSANQVAFACWQVGC
jgi:hypothetical protein